MKNSSYYIAPIRDRTHDLPHTIASNMVKVSHALTHSAMAAVNEKVGQHKLFKLTEIAHNLDNEHNPITQI